MGLHVKNPEGHARALARGLAARRGPLVLFLLLVLLFPPAGCGHSGAHDGPAITIAGSTSVQPFAEKLAEVYMREHTQAGIDVQGGGSSAGIYAAQEGAANLGASSRELAAAEKNLVEIPIAYDGIAVIVNRRNPLTNLSLAQIRGAFEGRLTNWRELGWTTHAIHLITREEGSGTRNAFEEMVMGKAEFTPSALVQDSNGSVRELVASDPYSLGYISVGLVDSRVKALSVDGVTATRENIRNHTYRLVRRFLLVSRQAPQGLAKAFVDFILGPQGQSLLESEGLVGVKE